MSELTNLHIFCRTERRFVLGMSVYFIFHQFLYKMALLTYLAKDSNSFSFIKNKKTAFLGSLASWLQTKR